MRRFPTRAQEPHLSVGLLPERCYHPLRHSHSFRPAATGRLTGAERRPALAGRRWGVLHDDSPSLGTGRRLSHAHRRRRAGNWHLPGALLRFRGHSGRHRRDGRSLGLAPVLLAVVDLVGARRRTAARGSVRLSPVVGGAVRPRAGQRGARQHAARVRRRGPARPDDRGDGGGCHRSCPRGSGRRRPVPHERSDEARRPRLPRHLHDGAGVRAVLSRAADHAQRCGSGRDPAGAGDGCGRRGRRAGGEARAGWDRRIGADPCRRGRAGRMAQAYNERPPRGRLGCAGADAP